MSPQQLLRETERSAGDDRLTAWHDALINAGKERRELVEVASSFLAYISQLTIRAQLLSTDNKQMETLKDRNAALERDVQRFKERKEIEGQVRVYRVRRMTVLTHAQIALLELIIPFMEYIEARDRYTKAKEVQRQLFKEVQALQRKHQPLNDLRKYVVFVDGSSLC
jgi:hypothetical protein